MLKGLKKQGISSLVHKKEGGYTHEAIEICFGREFRLEFLFGQEFLGDGDEIGNILISV
jgi:hypothetical protein